MKELSLGSQLISLGPIFFGRLANLFRQRARARKAFGNPARQRFQFEPLEGRLLLSADPIGAADVLTFDAPTNAAPDSFTLRLNSGNGNLELLDGETLVASQALSATTAVVINGEDGQDDSLTVDFAYGGIFALDDGITFNGGVEGIDKLSVVGGEFTSVTHTATSTGPGRSGSIVYEDGVNAALVINYTDLEPVDMTGSTITDLVFNLPGTDDQAVLEDDGTVGNGASQIRSANAAPTFELTIFSNPTSSLTVNMGGDSGSLTVLSMPDFTAALTIDGQGGTADSVIFASTTNLGSLAVTAETIDINQAISTTAVTTGAISLSGATINLGANLSTDGGSVSIAGSTAVVIDAATVIIDTESGNNGNAGVVTFAGTGLIHADAVGRNLVINTDTSNVGSSNRAVTLAAFGDGGVAFVNNVTIDADDAATLGAAVFMPAASQIAGTLSITAGAITSNAAFTAGASTTISLTSDAAITDGNGSSANYVAASLSASAVTRIDVDTNVATLTATVSGTGFINISDTAGGLTVNSATTSSGSITLNAAGGNLTLTTVAAGGAGDVIASTTAGGSIFAGNVLAIGNAVLLSSAGAIEESGADAGADLSAAILDLFAVTGVGAAAQIEIDADTSAGEGLTANVSGAGAINLRDLDALLVIAATTTAGAINLEAGGDLTLDAAIVASSLNVISAGSITDGTDADLDVTGNARFDALGAITLGEQAGNVTNFGTLTVVGGAVTISEDSATVLSGTSAVSSLSLTSAGSITDDADADINVIGSAGFLAGANAITLGDQPGNVVNFGTLAFLGGTVSITEDSASVLASSTAGSLSIVSGSSITVSGALSTTDASGSLTLTAAGNTNVNANLNAGTGSISAPGAVVFSGVGTRIVTGATFSAGSITISNSAIATLNATTGTVTGALNLSSLGALAGTGDVTVSGLTTFTGGTMTGSGDTITLGALTINGNVNLDAGRLLDVRGGANWIGNINLNPSSTGGAGSLTNRVGSVFEADAGAVLIHGVLFGGEVGPAPLFTNEGEFRKTGAGVTEIRAAFNNSGTVNINSGTLNLTGSGSHTGSFSGAGTLQFAGGTYDLLAGSSVTMANVTFTGNLLSTTNVGGTYAVTGTTRVDVGLANFTDATLASLGNTLILTGGTADLGASNQTVTTYSQNVASGANSVLLGTGDLTVSGTTTFTGGTMRGSGDTITLGALTINGNVNLDAGRLLDVRGGANWIGNINLNPSSTGGAGSLTNRVGSVFEADAGAVLIHGVLFGGEVGPAPLFTNEGEFRKTGAGVTEIRAAFNNNAVVTVETGTLSLTHQGSSTHTGSFSGAGTLQFAGGTQDLLAGSSVTTANATFTGNSGSVTNVGGTYAVTGTTRVDAGLADFTDATLTSLGSTLILTGGTADLGASNQTVTTYSQSGASGFNSVLSGTGDLTVSGTTTFTGGTMRGSGDTITLGALTINGNVNLDAGRLLDVRGGASWTAGAINLNPSSTGGAGSITNRAGSVFETGVDGGLIHGVLFGGEVGPAPLFTNEGVFLKSGGTGVTEIRAAFNNSGTVNANSGTLTLSNFPSNVGTLNILAGATLATNDQALINAASGFIQGAGTLDLSAGATKRNLTNDGTIRPGDSPGVLAIDGNVNFAGTSSFDVEVNSSTPGNGHDQLNVTGTVTLNGATLDATGTIASSPGQQIVLITNDGTDAILGTFNGRPEGSTIGLNGVDFILSYAGGDGNDVTLTEAGNDAPFVANAIADVTVDEDAADTLLDLSATFDDIDDATLTLSVVSNSNPALVSSSFAGSTLTLDYGADAFGSATITVRATDAGGLFAEDTFLVTVNPVNDTPFVANAIADVSVDEDAADTVLDLSETFADLDDATLTLSVMSNSNPALVLGSFSGSTLTLDYAADAFGSAAITIRATDAGGLFAEDSFQVTVAPVNDAPFVTNATPDVSVDEDAADTALDLSATFADVEDLDLTLSIVSSSNPALATANFVGTTLTLDYAPNAFGSAAVTIRATDAGGLFAEDTFLVTVNPVNDAPFVANAIADASVDEDATDTVLDLSATFDDIDDATLTLSIVSNGNPALVSSSFAGSTLTLDYGADAFGSATITVRATDAGGLFAEDTFLVTVNPVNDTPFVANAIADVSVDEDAADTRLDLSATFDDIDDATLTLSIVSNGNPALVSSSFAGSTLTLDYRADAFGSATITVRATDAGGLFAEDTFLVTVNPVNDAPFVANAIADASVDEDATDTVLDLSATFDDIDDATLTLSIVSNGNPALVSSSFAGSTLTLDYSADAFGSSAITIRASDVDGLFTEDSFLVTVGPVNDAPLANADSYATNENTALIIAGPGVLGNDTDVDSATLTAMLVSGPANGIVTLNADGSFTYTPDPGFSGSDSFTYRADDGTDQSNVATIAIAVNDTSAPGPDLVGAVEWVPPAVLTPGAKGQPLILVSNIGDASAPAPIRVNVYASADALFDPSDVLLDTKQTGPVAGGSSKDLQLNFRFPGTLAPGDYFLLAVMDSANSVLESNEANNVAVGAQFHFGAPASVRGQGNEAPAPSGVSSFAESSFSAGASNPVIDWQAGLPDGWGAGLTPFTPSKPGKDVSPNVADFLISLSSADRGAQGGYDSLGSELLGKGKGKPSR